MTPQQNNVPLLGQQRQQAQQATLGVHQAVQGLSLQIYTRIASGYVGRQVGIDVVRQSGIDISDFLAVDREHLQTAARASLVAAQAYFEGLGIAEFGESTEKGDGDV